MNRYFNSAALVSVFVLLDPTIIEVAAAQQSIAIELELVADGLASPVDLTHAGDGSGRLFIVDQTGLIRIVENGVLLPAPFLDISSKLPALNAVFDERGLLGMTFHPDYANNGRFFVRYSTPRVGGPDEPCTTAGFITGCHSEILAEYSVSVGDPNVADPGSEIILFSVDEPEFNHNAGTVAFGPDGFLYFSLGDGGGANDGLNAPGLPHGPLGNGQNIDTPLGSVLRIDVDGPPDVGLAYKIPPNNPFVGGPGLDEIWAYGMRNPYKFSFDNGPGGDGSLIVADVGQALFEEVDIVERGGNYGWAVREGFHCFDPFNAGVPPASCDTTGPILGDPLLDPVLEFLHPVPCTLNADCAALGVNCEPSTGLCANEGGISIIGGFVYRGSLNPALTGKYVFGDFSADFAAPLGRLYFADASGPNAFQREEFCLAPDNAPLAKFLKGFGEDKDGEIYVLVSDELGPLGAGGSVLRIVNASSEDCNGNGIADACETDADGDGVIDDCDVCAGGNDAVDRDGDGIPDFCDLCPDDFANDSDGDGLCDSDDLCPGADDTLDEDGNGVPDCLEAIPTVSEWGLVILTLLLLVSWKVVFARRPLAHHATTNAR